MMRRLDERSLRWPEFAGGVPIRLADGQVWTLAIPEVVVDTHATPTGPVQVPRLTFGEVFARDVDPDLDRVYHDVVDGFADCEVGGEEFYARCGAAGVLSLARNYEISDDEAFGLLYPTRGGEIGAEGVARLQAIFRLVVEGPCLALKHAYEALPYQDEASYLAYVAARN